MTRFPARRCSNWPRPAQSADELAGDLVEWALKSGTKDNATAAVLRMGQIVPTGIKPVFDAAVPGKVNEMPNGSKPTDNEETHAEQRVSNGLLTTMAILLIAFAGSLMWYAFFGLERGDKSDEESSFRLSPCLWW